MAKEMMINTTQNRLNTVILFNAVKQISAHTKVESNKTNTSQMTQLAVSYLPPLVVMAIIDLVETLTTQKGHHAIIR